MDAARIELREKHEKPIEEGKEIRSVCSFGLYDREHGPVRPLLPGLAPELSSHARAEIGTLPLPHVPDSQ